MKITRYPQSCLVVEHKGRKLIIDPGIDFLTTHKLDEITKIEAALYTHEHQDHYDPDIAKALRQQGARLYANAATARLIGEDDVTIVSDGDAFTVAGLEVVARELPHCLLPDGSAGPQNTGYVIGGVLFHPGDGKEIEGLRVNNLALPITGPDISILDAVNFARQVGAKVAIPIHYTVIPFDPNVFAAYAKRGAPQLEVRVLGDGEATEIE